MIVVAIIGILASIAIPAYQDYISRAQFTAGFAEISGGKTMAETLVSENAEAALDITLVGLQETTPNCSAITAENATGAVTITCTHIGSASIVDKVTTISRDPDTGVWSCASEVEAKYTGSKCVGA
jgi:type IV pilus assembly protein PilA